MSCRRAWRGSVLGAAVLTVTTSLLAQDTMVTTASWNDTEWVHGPLTSLNCADPNRSLLSRAHGRVLSGQVLSVDLDSIAEVQGVEVTNNGERARASAGDPVTGIPDAWADPLTVEALGAVQVPLDHLLELPADNSTGLVGQFAQAQRTGEALGASGYITNSGGIDLQPDPAGYPDLATLKLSNLLSSPLLGDLGLGPVLSSVTDLELAFGAVGGQARLDGCAALWSLASAIVDDIVPGLERDYLASSIDLRFNSDTVGDLVTAIGGTPDEVCDQAPISVLKGLECTVNGLASNDGVIDNLTDGIRALLVPVLDEGLGLAEDIDLDLNATIDVSPVRALLDDTLSDGVVSVNLADGTISIDTAALLTAHDAQRYDSGLNGLDPNSNPLADPDILTTLSDRVTSLLDAWVAQVEDKLDEVLDAVLVYVNVNVVATLTVTPVLLPPEVVDVAHIGATVDCQPPGTEPKGCSLGTLLDPEQNTSVTTASFSILPGLTELPVLGPIIEGLLAGVEIILESLVSTLISGLGGIVGAGVEDVLGTLRVLSPGVKALTTPIVNVVTTTYGSLLGGLDPVVAITINAQNDPALGDPEPQDWEGLPDGRYDVAAIRVGVLDALGNAAVALYLGRGSVGPACSLATSSPDCAGY